MLAEWLGIQSRSSTPGTGVNWKERGSLAGQGTYVCKGSQLCQLLGQGFRVSPVFLDVSEYLGGQAATGV